MAEVNSVRAKFEVIHVYTEPESDNGYTVELEAVYDPDPDSENGQFFQWTPSGNIRMDVVSKSVAEFFTPGEEVYVDFSKAKEPELG